METAKVFNNGRSQAVRIPKQYRFDVDEVYVNKIGDALIHLRTRSARCLTRVRRCFRRILWRMADLKSSWMRGLISDVHA